MSLGCNLSQVRNLNFLKNEVAILFNSKIVFLDREAGNRLDLENHIFPVSIYYYYYNYFIMYYVIIIIPFSCFNFIPLGLNSKSIIFVGIFLL